MTREKQRTHNMGFSAMLAEEYNINSINFTQLRFRLKVTPAYAEAMADETEYQHSLSRQWGSRKS